MRHEQDLPTYALRLTEAARANIKEAYRRFLVLDTEGPHIAGEYSKPLHYWS